LKKVTTSQKKVLESIMFTEPYDVLLSETGLQKGELRDDLIQLINAGLVEVFLKDDSKRLSGYDSDNLHYFSFRATSSGLKALTWR